MKSKTNAQFVVASFLLVLAIQSSGCQPYQTQPTNHFSTPAVTQLLPEPRVNKHSPSDPATAQPTVEQSNPESDSLETPGTPGPGVEEKITPPVDYSIQAAFDFSSQVIQIHQEVKYRVQSAQQTDFQLLNEPQLRAEDFAISEVRLDGEPVDNYQQGSGQIRVPLPESYSPGDTFTFEFDYAYRLPTRTGRLAATPYQINFGDWYLIVPPYVADRGWLTHPPSVVGEYLNYELASFDIHIDLQNEPPGLIVAASQQPEKSVDGYQFSVPISRSFAWSASPYYRSAETIAGDTHLTSYYFSNHEQAGLAALQTVAEAIESYNQLLGEIDLPSLAIVESQFSDGMEYHGLFFLGMEYYQEYDATAQNYLITIAAHETAHQWFYAVVGSDQALEPWTDEVLCTYLELMFYEERYPDLTNWWWQYRVNRFHPQGWVNSTVYDHTRFRSYVDAVYLRGAEFLQSIREQVGDENFKHSLRNYFVEHQYQFINGKQFLAAFEPNWENVFNEILDSYFLFDNQ